jgi:hypothetical protein
MKLNLRIETRDQPTLAEILNEPVVAEAKPIELGNGVTLKGLTWEFRKGDGFPDVVTLIVECGLGVSSGIAANLLTSWLWKVRHRVERVTIEKTEIEFDSSEKVKKIVTERIAKESGIS